MSSILHMPWIGRDLEVIRSFDPTYHGRRGMIVEETQRTLIIKKITRQGKSISLRIVLTQIQHNMPLCE